VAGARGGQGGPVGQGYQHKEGVLSRKVVIAEDEAIVRLDLREILEEEGYEVVGETGRGDEAVELVRAHEPDLVVLDIKMPGMDGLAAAKAINEQRRSAVLILTAFSQRDLIEQARDAGALAYLVKPFQKEELLPAIEVALGRYAEMQALEAENLTLSDDKRGLQEQLETRRWVDRAKGRLMDDHGLNESKAFAFIQQSAMNRRMTMRDVAHEVVEGSLAPDPEPA
jgi:response regulator NasT